MCAKQAATSTRYWLDQYNLTGMLTAVEMEIKQALPPVQCFSDAGPRRVVDNYDHSHSYSGLFDAEVNSLGASSFDAVLDGLRTGAFADHYLAELFAGNVEGNPVYESIVQMEGEPRSALSSRGVLLNLTAQGSNSLYRATILRSATIAGNGDGTGRNVGTSTPGQTLVVVVRTFSGTFTSFDWKVQGSTDDAATDAYADITGLSGSVAAAGVSRTTVTLATETWKRLVISNWIGTSAVIACTIGVVGANVPYVAIPSDGQVQPPGAELGNHDYYYYVGASGDEITRYYTLNGTEYAVTGWVLIQYRIPDSVAWSTQVGGGTGSGFGQAGPNHFTTWIYSEPGDVLIATYDDATALRLVTVRSEASA